MTLNEYLAAEGLSTEEIAAIVGNEKQSKAMTKALGLAEEGKTLKAQAAAEKQETATFWEQKTQELQGSVNKLTAAERRAAQAEAESARVKAYNKSLADQGYDIPKEYYEGAPTTPPPGTPPNPGNYLTREQFDEGRRGNVDQLAALTELSNRYSYLHGKPYLSVKADIEEARKQGKTLTDYASQKYNFAAKEQEIAQAADQKRVDALVDEKYKVKEAELAAKYGSNPETRAPMASKFDSVTKQPGFKSDSWKSPEGRKANREERLKRFENSSIQ